MFGLIPFAQVVVERRGFFGMGWGIGEIAIAIVIIAAIVALVYVALRQFGVSIPSWVVQCFWILVVAFVVVFCIKLLIAM